MDQCTARLTRTGASDGTRTHDLLIDNQLATLLDRGGLVSREDAR